MIKTAVKKLIGPHAANTLTSGRETLRMYPQYVMGQGKAKPPDHLTIETTYRCNVRCRMCPYYGEHMDGHPRAPIENELTTAELKSLLDQAAALGVKKVTFTGGETFLRHDTLELVTYARRLGLRTEILSSGSLGSEKLAAALIDSGLHALGFSIDGPAEVHDYIRRVPGLFTRVDRFVASIRAVQAERGVSDPAISVNCTVSALNQDRLHEIIEPADRWKARVAYYPIYFSPPDGNGEASGEPVPAKAAEEPGTSVKPEDWHLPEHIRKTDPAVIATNLETARRLGAEHGVFVTDNIGEEEDVRRWFYDYTYARNNKCMFPWGSVRVAAYGDVYPCSIEGSMGNLRSSSLAEIWNCAKYVGFRQKLRRAGLFPGCAKCCLLNRRDVVCRLLPRFA